MLIILQLFWQIFKLEIKVSFFVRRFFFGIFAFKFEKLSGFGKNNLSVSNNFMGFFFEENFFCTKNVFRHRISWCILNNFYFNNKNK